MPMHARIGTFDVPPRRLDEVLVFFRERIVSAFTAHEGFLGYQAYVDPERGRFVGISLWTTRAALERSRETARVVLGQASHLGAVTVAEPEILELAFDARPSS
jgi:quinol monooxygenase YgiN